MPGNARGGVVQMSILLLSIVAVLVLPRTAKLLDRYAQAVIVVTPLGGNGFIFGRGNKQFTPQVLRRVGRKNILVIGDRNKLLKLASLHVDTGDLELDESLSGYIDVMVGRGYTKLMRVAG